jgi:hypothetical protein
LAVTFAIAIVGAVSVVAVVVAGRSSASVCCGKISNLSREKTDRLGLRGYGGEGSRTR